MRFYKMILTKGEDFIVNEDELQRIIDHPSQIVTLLNKQGNIRFIINKAHIVSVAFDHKEEEQIQNLLEDNINISDEKILELREKAHRLKIS